jgi:hypothetical protein
VSARKAYGVCPLGRRRKARYRNRKAALSGLDTIRQDCRRAGTPEEVWPADIYRCPSRLEGGCGGWHLYSDRQAVEDYLRGGLRVPRVTTAPTLELAPIELDPHDTADQAA